MTKSLRTQIAEMSQAELDAYLDKLAERGREDSREFQLAYTEWERRDV